MARGFLSGFVVGGVLSAVAASGVSLALGLPERLQPPQPLERASAGSTGDARDGLAVTGASLTTSEAERSPDAAEDTAVTGEDSAGTGTAGTGAEGTDSQDSDPQDKDTAPPPREPANRPAAETPVQETDLPGIARPGRDTTTEASLPRDVTDPGERPDATQTVEAPDPVPTPLEGTSLTPQPGDDSPLLRGTDVTAPPPPTVEEGPVLGVDTSPPPPPGTGSVATGEGSVSEAGSDAENEAGSDSNADTELAALDKPAVRNLPQNEERTGTGIGTPAGSLIDRAPATAIRRPSAANSDPEEAVLENLPPLRAFAEPVEIKPGTGRMAIVLIHDGVGPMGPGAVIDFPFPLTFAVDATLPGAEAVMKGYRDAGFEVMALVDIPAGTTGFDVDFAAQAALAKVPEAVAVMEGLGAGLQSSREISTQLSQFLSDSGHGLVMLPNGLNTAQALAAKAGVPSASVFRDFDGTGQDGRTMRRFLDQAAFRTRQEGPVIMLGRMRPNTISALLLWGLQDRAATLTFVPVSNVLLGE